MLYKTTVGHDHINNGIGLLGEFLSKCLDILYYYTS